jgi:EAL domain-containing protein (putative c-di-GMP-specific phosphodiesterase class I)
VFDATLRSVSSIKQQREEVLRSALAEGRVELHYQPLFRLDDSSSIGVEALARLRDRQGELVMPAAFIPLAEDSGLIVPLGNEVLSQVCRQLAAWRVEGKERFATVNVSARQAARPDLPDVVHGALDDAGLNPDALWLELTETALLEASPATLRHLLRLRSLGVRIGIDDFGTGYASLRYLRDLPVDFIKIDRSFVSDLTRHRDARAIVGAVARLAGELRLDCVAEGVEEPGQLAVLRDLSVTHVQGFLLGRPVPAAELLVAS